MGKKIEIEIDCRAKHCWRCQFLMRPEPDKTTFGEPEVLTVAKFAHRCRLFEDRGRPTILDVHADRWADTDQLFIDRHIECLRATMSIFPRKGEPQSSCVKGVARCSA